MGDAIEVLDVAKHYRLYHEKPSSLKDRIVRRARSRYDDLWALRDVSFTVGRGSAFGLIGHNGSGKSTLLRLIARVHQPTRGRVVTHGRIGALLELGAGFHPELTGRENIFLNGSIMGLNKKQIRASFDAILEFSGLEEFIDNPVKVYSSGMYLRLGFAVAVNLDPEILLVDEVISVGDEEFQRRCMDHVHRLKREGCAIVVVSHDLDVVRSLCDEVALLDHGRLIAEGGPPEVIQQYLDMVDARAGAPPGL